MMIKIYYGLSGTFKGTTISALDHDAKVMKSSIKPWKHYQFGPFKGLVTDNDLTYGILHLVRLEEVFENLREGDDLSVERSISDCLFYYSYSDEFEKEGTLTEEKVKELVEEEKKMLEGKEVKRILLIQKDRDFIRDVILKEPTRQKTFKGDVDYYLEMEDRYVEWTNKYNDIDEVIEIDNAKDYIKTLCLQVK